MVLSKRQTTRAVIIGSFIGFLVSQIDYKPNNKTQRVLSKGLATGLQWQADLSNKVFLKVLNSDKESKIEPTIVIETLFFNDEKLLVNYFGGKLRDSVIRFLELHQMNNTDVDISRNSYKIADLFTKITEKELFELIKKGKI